MPRQSTAAKITGFMSQGDHVAFTYSTESEDFILSGTHERVVENLALLIHTEKSLDRVRVRKKEKHIGFDESEAFALMIVPPVISLLVYLGLRCSKLANPTTARVASYLSLILAVGYFVNDINKHRARKNRSKVDDLQNKLSSSTYSLFSVNNSNPDALLESANHLNQESRLFNRHIKDVYAKHISCMTRQEITRLIAMTLAVTTYTSYSYREPEPVALYAFVLSNLAIISTSLFVDVEFRKRVELRAEEKDLENTLQEFRDGNVAPRM